MPSKRIVIIGAGSHFTPGLLGDFIGSSELAGSIIVRCCWRIARRCNLTVFQRFWLTDLWLTDKKELNPFSHHTFEFAFVILLSYTYFQTKNENLLEVCKCH